MTIETDRGGRWRAPEREVERHDAMARVALIEGYLYGTGKANVARALARKRNSEKIRSRRAAHDAARALHRTRKLLQSIR